MKLELLGTESRGVRRLCRRLQAGERVIAIEVRRREPYATLPPRAGWHEVFARERATTDDIALAVTATGAGAAQPRLTAKEIA